MSRLDFDIGQFATWRKARLICGLAGTFVLAQVALIAETNRPDYLA